MRAHSENAREHYRKEAVRWRRVEIFLFVAFLMMLVIGAVMALSLALDLKVALPFYTGTCFVFGLPLRLAHRNYQMNSRYLLYLT